MHAYIAYHISFYNPNSYEWSPHQKSKNVHGLLGEKSAMEDVETVITNGEWKPLFSFM